MSIESPKKMNSISRDAQWLGGIGAGSWFTIVLEKDKYRIERYSPNGELECSRLFTVNNTEFNIDLSFKFIYVSHCKMCTIIQNKITYIFTTDEY